METLRVIQVTHSFPPYVGGLSNMTEMLSKNLVKLGHEVEVVTLDVEGGLPKCESMEGVSIRRFKGYAPSGAYFAPSTAAYRYLESVRGDVIHAHNIAALLVPACWMAVRGRLDSTAFVITPHHHSAGSKWHTRLLWRPYRPVARRVMRAADVIHCVSSFEAGVVKHDFGVDSMVVPNGVSEDVANYQWSPSSDLVLTYAGRLEGYKRIDSIVLAAHRLAKEGREVHVRIVGDGPDLSRLVSLGQSLDVNIQHFHFLQREEYLRMLSTSSCLVNVSEYEAFSIVVAEAIAMGVPTIAAAPWGGTFAGMPGVQLVDGSSAEAIARAVDALSSNHCEKTHIPSWPEIANRLTSEAYLPALSRKA
ncbi:MAG: glycosyltransferase family 4 protein [Conexivisphaerales archaeon]